MVVLPRGGEEEILWLLLPRQRLWSPGPEVLITSPAAPLRCARIVSLLHGSRRWTLDARLTDTTTQSTDHVQGA